MISSAMRRITAPVGVVKTAALSRGSSVKQCMATTLPARCISAEAIRKGHLRFDDVEGRKSIVREGRQNDVPDCTSAQEQVYSWMGWSPEPGSPCWRALHSNFPGALPGPAVLHRTARILNGYGMKPQNTLLGLSICPDEINNQAGHLAHSMQKYWGEQFPLGGIGGPPFVGKTGFGAFSAHVSDEGHICLLFGPHIGINIDGVVGQVRREGQHLDTTACGAFIAAYNDCVSDTPCPYDMNDPDDRQQSYLKQQLDPHVKKIKDTPEPMAALSLCAYEIVLKKMENIIHTRFGPGYMALIGGVQLNMPHGFEDHFWPLVFELRAEGKPTINLLNELSCDTTGKGSMIAPF